MELGISCTGFEIDEEYFRYSCEQMTYRVSRDPVIEPNRSEKKSASLSVR
jgi:hypothetical protein